MAKYGPPYYDISNVATYLERIEKQGVTGKPHAMYSSHWHEFGREVLRGNPLIKRELRNIANRGLFALKRVIPLGDASDGHFRNELKVKFHRRGARYKDRNTYTIEYTGENRAGWNAAVARSKFKNSADFKNATRGVGKSWLDRAKDMM